MEYRGDFTINSGVTFSSGFSADFIVRGNLNQQPASVYSIQNSTDNNFVKIEGNINNQGQIAETGTGFPVLELNGLSNQNINISGGNMSDVFTAEYKRNNPQTVHGPAVEPGMDHVSYVEYWMLVRDA